MQMQGCQSSTIITLLEVTLREGRRGDIETSARIPGLAVLPRTVSSIIVENLCDALSSTLFLNSGLLLRARSHSGLAVTKFLYIPTSCPALGCKGGRRLAFGAPNAA